MAWPPLGEGSGVEQRASWLASGKARAPGVSSTRSLSGAAAAAWTGAAGRSAEASEAGAWKAVAPMSGPGASPMVSASWPRPMADGVQDDEAKPRLGGAGVGPGPGPGPGPGSGGGVTGVGSGGAGAGGAGLDGVDGVIGVLAAGRGCGVTGRVRLVRGMKRVGL